jgi:hypothetical protein
MLACSNCHIELFRLCRNKYHMTPTSEHLETVLGAERSESHVPSSETFRQNQYDMVADILICKVVPDAKTFEAWIDGGYNGCNESLLELLIKFGLLITFDNVIYAIEKRDIMIDNLEKYNIEYNEKLYFNLVLKKYSISDGLIKKFTMDQNVLRLRQLCTRSNATIGDIKKFMGTHGCRLDYYCVDNVARAGNKSLLYDLMRIIKIPSPTVYILLANHNDIYLEIVKEHNIGPEYMATPYDIAIP